MAMRDTHLTPIRMQSPEGLTQAVRIDARIPASKNRIVGNKDEKVTLPDGTLALKVSYARGGVTPGDSYVWVSGPTGLPLSWRMWVSILPIHGLRVTWEDWKTLDTGVRVATGHRVLGMNQPHLTDVKAAATLSQLSPGPDPFAPLVQATAQR